VAVLSHEEMILRQEIAMRVIGVIRKNLESLQRQWIIVLSITKKLSDRPKLGSSWYKFIERKRREHELYLVRFNDLISTTDFTSLARICELEDFCRDATQEFSIIKAEFDLIAIFYSVFWGFDFYNNQIAQSLEELEEIEELPDYSDDTIPVLDS